MKRRAVTHILRPVPLTAEQSGFTKPVLELAETRKAAMAEWSSRRSKKTVSEQPGSGSSRFQKVKINESGKKRGAPRNDPFRLRG